MEISLIILAAGKSSRTGSLGRKPLLPWPVGPGSLLGAVLENYKTAWGWHEAVVVHRDDTPIYERIVQDAGAPYRSVINPSEDAVMSDSLRLALAALSSESDGTLIGLGDMPFIKVDVLQTILNQATSQKIVQPTLNNRPANPVFFPKAFVEELKAARGDHGGREVIKKHPDRVHRISFSDPKPFRDIDTADDYSIAVQNLNTR